MLRPQRLSYAPDRLFYDRPILKNGHLYFISAHEQPDQLCKSWTALYSVEVCDKMDNIRRLSPYEVVDYSPTISKSGNFVAVASYGSRSWEFDFHQLKTDIVVFPTSDPNNRVVVCKRGGWPTWSGDSTIFFHRQAEDGWWSIYRVEFAESSTFPVLPLRVTPPGVHCFTPAAFQDGRRIAVATRRRDNKYRHIEIFDMELKVFLPVTELVNPSFHHYNPFVSPNSEFLGYHRFRGKSARDESIVPHLEVVTSPIQDLHMLRINGNFPSFSPDGNLIAMNTILTENVKGDIKILKLDGSKQWTLIKGRTAFCNSWSPTEKHVIYTSLGPIFGSTKETVQIARITFNPSHLDNDCKEIPCDVKILTREDSGNNAFPSCSPDGKSLVFRSGRSGHKNLYIIDAVNGEFDNGSIHRLTNGPWNDTMQSWSPNGDLIAFSSTMHNPNNADIFGIYVIKPDGSDLRRIYVAGSEGSSYVDLEQSNHVCFSQDGEWLLFTTNMGGNTAEPISLPNHFQPYGDLYMMRLDGSGLRRLTCNAYENGSPAWHPIDELDMKRLLLRGEDEVILNGDFDDPFWITCDFD